MPQRPIRFRAYDKKNKGFVYFELFANGATSVQSNFPDLLTSDITPWEQFTNIKDIEDRDIYEGDIVQMIHRESEGGGWYSESHEHGRVYFDVNWGVKFDCRNSGQRVSEHWKGEGTDAKHKNLDAVKHWSDFEMVRNYRDIKVIGNIHENPDLIESGAKLQEA